MGVVQRRRALQLDRLLLTHSRLVAGPGECERLQEERIYLLEILKNMEHDREQQVQLIKATLESGGSALCGRPGSASGGSAEVSGRPGAAFGAAESLLQQMNKWTLEDSMKKLMKVDGVVRQIEGARNSW